MIIRPQLRGCSGIPLTHLHTVHGLGDGSPHSPVGCRGKAPAGGLNWGVHRSLSVLIRGVKIVLFLNKTSNHFVETSNLPVIRLPDVMCHVAAVLERKIAGEVKRSYVITTSTVCVK